MAPKQSGKRNGILGIIIANILALLSAPFTSGLGPYILWPGISDAAAGFAWIAAWFLGAIFSLTALITAIVISQSFKKYGAKNPTVVAVQTSKNILVFVCIVEMIPGAMLFLAIPVVVIDIVAHAAIVAAIVTIKCKENRKLKP